MELGGDRAGHDADMQAVLVCHQLNRGRVDVSLPTWDQSAENGPKMPGQLT
jgi:hypothetical protein